MAAVEKLAADVTTEVETALGKEKRLEEQIGRMKQRLERSTVEVRGLAETA